MNEADAQAKAERLIGSGVASQLSQEDWDDALAQSVMLDTAGRAPSDTGWNPTYCPYWAAAEALGTLTVRAATTGGDILKFTSEGATFEMTVPDMRTAADLLRAKSPILRYAIRPPALGSIDVDQHPVGYVPTSGQDWI